MRLNINRHFCSDFCASNKFYGIFYVIVNWILFSVLDLVFGIFGNQCFWSFGSPVHYSPHCVDDDWCVAIHDLSPVLTALFSIELRGFNNYYIIITQQEEVHAQ